MVAEYYSDIAKKYEGKSGIYFIHFGASLSQCLYIGKSFDICQRLLAHEKKYSRDCVKISIRVLDNIIHGLSHKEACLIVSLWETFYISVFNPVDNKSRPSLFDMLFCNQCRGDFNALREQKREIINLLSPNLKELLTTSEA